MSRTATTYNEFEFGKVLNCKITNFDIRQRIMDSFHKHGGNLREVTGDMMEIIQTIYMERCELEFHLDPPTERSRNGKGNQGISGSETVG